MKSNFLVREKMVQKAYGVKITRAEHTSQDWGQTLIFTYRHRCDYLTDNECQRLVGPTVSQQLVLIGATISGLSMLIEGAKEKIYFF